MDNSQVVTIALAAVPNMLAVLAGILINNSRLTDTNTRIGELRTHVGTRFDENAGSVAVRTLSCRTGH
jgi:hypothetical protein